MTHTFNIDKGSIRLVVSHNGKQYKRATGLTISPDLWNKDAKTLPSKCRDRKVWEKLRFVHLRASEKEVWVEKDSDVPRVMEYAITGVMPEEKPDTPRPLSFWEYFDEWSSRECSQMRQKRLCYRNI